MRIRRHGTTILQGSWGELVKSQAPEKVLERGQVVIEMQALVSLGMEAHSGPTISGEKPGQLYTVF